MATDAKQETQTKPTESDYVKIKRKPNPTVLNAINELVAKDSDVQKKINNSLLNATLAHEQTKKTYSDEIKLLQDRRAAHTCILKKLKQEMGRNIKEKKSNYTKFETTWNDWLATSITKTTSLQLETVKLVDSIIEQSALSDKKISDKDKMLPYLTILRTAKNAINTIDQAAEKRLNFVKTQIQKLEKEIKHLKTPLTSSNIDLNLPEEKPSPQNPTDQLTTSSKKKAAIVVGAAALLLSAAGGIILSQNPDQAAAVGQALTSTLGIISLVVGATLLVGGAALYSLRTSDDNQASSATALKR